MFINLIGLRAIQEELLKDDFHVTLGSLQNRLTFEQRRYIFTNTDQCHPIQRIQRWGNEFILSFLILKCPYLLTLNGWASSWVVCYCLPWFSDSPNKLQPAALLAFQPEDHDTSHNLWYCDPILIIYLLLWVCLSSHPIDSTVLENPD